MRGWRRGLRTAGLLILGLGGIAAGIVAIRSTTVFVWAGWVMVEVSAFFLLLWLAKPASLKARPWFWRSLVVVILIGSLYLHLVDEVPVLGVLFVIVNLPAWLWLSIYPIFFL